nr:uncharacterized protein LOC127314030 [Lolium perenne]
MGIVVPSPSLSASLPTLGNETLVSVTRRLSAFLGGETSQSGPPTVAAISAPPKSESLPTMLNGSPGPITKKQLQLALASALALAGGGTSSDSSSQDSSQCN